MSDGFVENTLVKRTYGGDVTYHDHYTPVEKDNDSDADARMDTDADTRAQNLWEQEGVEEEVIDSGYVAFELSSDSDDSDLEFEEEYIDLTL